MTAHNLPGNPACSPSPSSAFRGTWELIAARLQCGRVAGHLARVSPALAWPQIRGSALRRGLCPAGYRTALALANLRGWGYEDFDFQIRLQLGLGLERVSLGQAQHVTHPPTSTAALSHARNIAIAWHNYSEGKLDGTFNSDVDRLKNSVVELAL